MSGSGEQADLRLYTLGEKSQRTGMFGLPLRATIIAGIAFIVAMLVLMQGGLGAGALIAVLAVAYLAPAVLRIGNRTLYEVAQMRWQFWRAQAAGSTVYRSGPNSRVPGGRYRLPGALAKTELHVGRDVAGNDFALIRDRALNQYTVLLDAASRGQEPLTATDRNDMTAEWGAWLAELSLNDDVVAATVTVESYPTTGQDLIAAVKDSVSESTPEIARRIQAESAVEFARGKLVTRSWIAVTFKAATAMQRKDPEAMATDLGFRLPGLYQRLEYAGVSATPMNPEDAIGLALRCYRPDLEETINSARLSGEPLGVDWDDAGPAEAVAKWNHYRHEDWVSRSFEMAAPPAAAFPDHVLRPLLEPKSDIPRKRVTLIYRPIAAGDGVRQVEKEHTDAVNAANKTRSIGKASAGLRLERTEAARQALARGGQLGEYSLLVTLTLRNPELLDQGSAIIGQLGNRSQLRLHATNGQQDAAFAAALGLGVLLDQKSTISSFAKAE